MRSLPFCSGRLICSFHRLLPPSVFPKISLDYIDFLRRMSRARSKNSCFGIFLRGLLQKDTCKNRPGLVSLSGTVTISTFFPHRGILMENQKKNAETGPAPSDFFAYLRSNVDKKHWDLWFKSLELVEILTEKRLVVLRTSNLFVKDWILSRYGKVLTTAVKSFFGSAFSFELKDMVLTDDLTNCETKSIGTRYTEKKPLEICSLNNQYTFEDFIPGGGNLLAFQSAKSVSAIPGRYNPLFIFGDVGLGKTHLLQAIGHDIRTRYPEKKVMYVSSEQFMNELVQSIKQDRIEQFRHKYRNTIDILLIDDIQFLIGKMGIQNELFHTFNLLFDANKQIAFCSDRTPKDLGTFHERLISRFQMGLVVELTAPDIETRKRIIEKISKREKITMSPSVISYLAHAIKDNIRKVYGTIVKLIMMNQLQGKKIDVQTLKEVLEEDRPALSGGDTQIIRLGERERYFSIVEKAFGITKADLVSDSRKKEVSELRKVAIYIAHKQMHIPVLELSKWFQKTHSTVHYAIAKTQENYDKQYPTTVKLVEDLKLELSRMRSSAQA